VEHASRNKDILYFIE